MECTAGNGNDRRSTKKAKQWKVEMPGRHARHPVRHLIITVIVIITETYSSNILEQKLFQDRF